MKVISVARIFIIFLILVLLFNVFNLSNVFASWGGSGNYTSIHQFDDYTTTNNSNANKVDTLLSNALKIALTVLRTVTFGWAIFSLIYIAIYMMTESSPWDKMRMQENHIPTYILGVILLFGATGILKFITYFVNETLQEGKLN